jgi:hypothetical protein
MEPTDKKKTASKRKGVPREVWWLPRPRIDRYKGGFPLHFEKKLMRFLGNPPRVLQPFAGHCEFGVRVDFKRENRPDVIADAHSLPFKEGVFDLVLLDPPYADSYAKKLYDTPPLSFKRYSAEAVRVCKKDGFVVVYHYMLSPRLPGTKWDHLLVLITRVWHKARVVSIFRKE